MSNDGTTSILKGKRKGLTGDEGNMIRTIVDHIEAELIDALPELIHGVRVSGKQASFSPTVSLNVAKRNNLTVKVSARVRAARQPLEFEAHLTDDDQLALGWEPEPEPLASVQ